jgi:hypothetical protein
MPLSAAEREPVAALDAHACATRARSGRRPGRRARRAGREAVRGGAGSADQADAAADHTGRNVRRAATELPHELVAAWNERVPALRPQVVPRVNHYTIMFNKEGAAAVSQAIRAAVL